MKIGRITSLLFGAGILVLAAGCGSTDSGKSGVGTNGKPQKDDKGLLVGFAQEGAESGWRTAETDSIRNEAKARNINLKFADAQGQQEKQIAAVRNFIRQGVKAIIIAPKTKDGWAPVLKEAKAANIPVVLVDRGITVADDSLYATLISSDFVEEGKMAALRLMAEVEKRVPKSVKRKRVIYELLGTTGADPAIDRRKGFEQEIAKHPEYVIAESRNGDFDRSKGKQAMEALIKIGTPDAVYAHNDDMAIGAIQAMEAAGKKPGKDIVVVSIDGEKDALKALKEGKLNATIECSPLLGPLAFDAIEKLVAGQQPKDKKTINKDSIFDQERAKKEFDSRPY